jgi:Xaa-Pro aminopeptidase
VFDAITKRTRPGTTIAELIDATSIIEANGLTTCDDVVHGYGGGYFQPIIGSKSRPAANQPQITLRENMCMVVQPNVITRDKTAGVQTGEMVRVTGTGFQTLHNMSHGLFRAGQTV